MAGSDYVVDGSRIGEDGAVSISWSEICDTNATGWNEGNQLIIAATAKSESHTPASESFQIRWKVSGGSFAAITDAGALQNGVSAGCISNGDPVGSECGCEDVAISDSEECESESPHQTASLNATAKYDSIEVQSCIDMSGAPYDATYEFELYSVTEGVSCGVLVTVTIRSDPAGAFYAGKGIDRGINRGIL